VRVAVGKCPEVDEEAEIVGIRKVRRNEEGTRYVFRPFADIGANETW
jgi:hypothetical protein